MTAYDFSTLIAALDTRGQSLATAATAKDLVYLGKAVEALQAGDDKLLASSNLSDVADAAAALANLGFAAQFTNPTGDQGILYDASINKWVNTTLNTYEISTTNPAYNSGDYSLGSVKVNSTTGEIFVCVSVDTSASPTEYKWIGSAGTKVGYLQGEVLFVNENYTGRTIQTYAAYNTSFTVPDGVTSICAVCVGGGAGGNYSWSNSGGGGGALAWANSITVTPGEVLSISVGHGGGRTADGGDSTISRGSNIIFGAQGGHYNATSVSNIAAPIAGTVTPGNNDSGRGGLCSANGYGGGGGAGGYSGNGGNGTYGTSTNGNNNNTFNTGIGGTGGAAAGGQGYQSSTYGFGGGGGVGLYGEGASGTATGRNDNSFYSDQRHAGRGGSGGESGADNSNSTGDNITPTETYSGDIGTFGEWNNSTKSFPDMSTDGTVKTTGSSQKAHGQGGHFGGGGGGGGTSISSTSYYCTGGMGGVRILWGEGRSFPSTNVKKLPTLNRDGSGS